MSKEDRKNTRGQLAVQAVVFIAMFTVAHFVCICLEGGQITA